ncbi:uncharacterized protein LOC106640176 [Copidosoma floridanum]|uniref:uncharacterized protein LOC106640176 n=1 Tax=Copidosoma floridanum TaxID=29053 RepID=UPI000C6FC2EA|nr:uncharacterized protein LOC106640176 [Copidosoma floridanum]
MSVKTLNDCELTYPISKHKTTIELTDNIPNLPIWKTETQEIFVLPKVENPKIGKRRDMLMKYFRMRASKDALEKIIGDPLPPESACFTEYIDNFCDNDFIPQIENSDKNIQQLAKNLLYDGTVKTYYKEQFDKKKMKVNVEFRNEKRPFVRRTLFTTPPEIALEEPEGGF